MILTLGINIYEDRVSPFVFTIMVTGTHLKWVYKSCALCLACYGRFEEGAALIMMLSDYIRNTEEEVGLGKSVASV